MTREIPLTRGYVALVDDEDYERVAAFKWTVVIPSKRQPRAVRYVREGGKIRSVQMSRFLMEPPAHLVVDHINHDPLDNRRGNLRICTPAQNSQNSRRPFQKSGFRGVSKQSRGNGYFVKISADRRIVVKGGFATAEAAARAYDTLARALHGEFATLNFPAERAA